MIYEIHLHRPYGVEISRRSFRCAQNARDEMSRLMRRHRGLQYALFVLRDGVEIEHRQLRNEAER